MANHNTELLSSNQTTPNKMSNQKKSLKTDSLKTEPLKKEPLKIESQRNKVWDFPTRVFHWGLVVAVSVSLVSAKTDNMEIHVTSGSFVLGLLVFRLLWGVWGASTAQFHRFIPTPQRLFDYLFPSKTHSKLSKKKNTEEDIDNDTDVEKVIIGHSPIGALSVIALLGVLIFQTMTGLVADDDIYITGPLIDWVDGSTSSWATSLHLQTGDFLLALIALHIAAIVFYRIVKKMHLVTPMITGFLSAKESTKIVLNPLQERRLWLSVLSISIAVLLAYGIFNWV